MLSYFSPGAGMTSIPLIKFIAQRCSVCCHITPGVARGYNSFGPTGLLDCAGKKVIELQIQ